MTIWVESGLFFNASKLFFNVSELKFVSSYFLTGCRRVLLLHFRPLAVDEIFRNVFDAEELERLGRALDDDRLVN